MAFAKLNSMKFVGLDGLSHFWSKAKTWIINRITTEVTTKIAEVVANAPEDLDTLKEIADWISSHANDAATMNTAISTNTSDIATLKTSVAGKADKSHTHTKSEITDFDHTHDDRYYTESEVDTKLSSKADKSHTHTKSEITDFPTSLKNPNALIVNGKTYDGSSEVDAGVQTIANGGTGVTTQADINKAFIGSLGIGNDNVTDGTEFVSSWASDNGFSDTNAINKPYKRKFIKVWEYIKGKISSVLGLTKDNYGGKSAKSSFLDEYVGAGGTRPTSINFVPKDSSEYGGMRKDVITDAVMTDSGYPGQNGHLLTMFWDNSGRYDSQFFVSNEKQPTTVKVRVKANEADYGPWVDLITSQNIGSQTVAKATTATNDSNGNNISNTYMPKSGGTFSGSVTFEKPTHFNDEIHGNKLFPKGSIDSMFSFFKDTTGNYLPSIYGYNCGYVFNNDMCLRYYKCNYSKTTALNNLHQLKKLFASMYPDETDGCARCTSIHARISVTFTNGQPAIIGDIINYGYCNCDGIARVNKDGSVYVGEDFYSNYHVLYISYDDGFKEKDAYYLANEILKNNMSNINYFSFIGNYVLAEHL